MTLLSKKLRKQSRLARAVALLFLVYTGIDLACPELCNGDALGDSKRVAIVLSVPSVNESATTLTSVQAEYGKTQRQIPEQPCCDEDCLCCCAHIVPVAITVSLEASDKVTASSMVEPQATPAPALPSEFHPPRFA